MPHRPARCLAATLVRPQTHGIEDTKTYGDDAFQMKKQMILDRVYCNGSAVAGRPADTTPSHVPPSAL
jgi:hypothetical protein